MEDSFGDRIWVEDENTKEFVENLMTVFPRIPQEDKSQAVSKTMDNKQSVPSEVSDTAMEEYEDEVESGGVVSTSVPVRYNNEFIRERVRTYTLGLFASQLEHPENSKNLMKVFSVFCVLKEIRLKASELLEGIMIIYFVIYKIL